MAEVKKWLDELGLGKYKKKFEEHEYNDMDIINGLSDSEIEEMIKLIGFKAGGSHKIRNYFSSLNRKSIHIGFTALRAVALFRDPVTSCETDFSIGENVEAQWSDGIFYNAKIRCKTSTGYLVHYYEYGEEQDLHPLQIRKVNHTPQHPGTNIHTSVDKQLVDKQSNKLPNQKKCQRNNERRAKDETKTKKS